MRLRSPGGVGRLGLPFGSLGPSAGMVLGPLEMPRPDHLSEVPVEVLRLVRAAVSFHWERQPFRLSLLVGLFLTLAEFGIDH